ncbi:serine protease inhibitor 88Ea [Anastrepha ludens]|uniref:serine protease inhibitor 88Ea n=1 Tax=Anastrepha ludens TaxID=28586 RepID=UPI0023AEA3EC|nr:serine protease inhibitor 88Ea [Anastrepha ludens]XP_053968447.1 serine protease inhibitor 88Ea [Anastrepha ludens]
MARLSLQFLTLVVCVLTPCILAQETCQIGRDISDVPRTVRSDLYRGQQNFTVVMLQAINKATPNENVFFSPYSTYHALLLAYFGARGQTEAELTQALSLQWAKNKNHVLSGYNLEKKSRVMRAKKMPLQFAGADRIYFDTSVALTDCVRDIFHEELESVDFRNNAEQSRIEINNWIGNVTQNEIPDMLNPGDVDSQTQLVLANAAYFKGQWSRKFDPKDTTKDIFYTSESKHSFVDMMHKRGTYNLALDEYLGAYVLEMPYVTSNDNEKESDISMIIILPPFHNLDGVLAKLTPNSLDDALKEGMAREVDVALPKFAFEQNLELVPILREIGIRSLFEKEADLGDFSSNSLQFGDAKHVAKIKVDEEGSTASAGTVLFSFRSARPLEPTKFECNHPFLFLIYDYSAKAILFTGIYRDPMTQK